MVVIHLNTVSDTHFVITVEVFYSAFKILETHHALNITVPGSPVDPLAWQLLVFNLVTEVPIISIDFATNPRFPRSQNTFPTFGASLRSFEKAIWNSGYFYPITKGYKMSCQEAYSKAVTG